MPIKEIT
ncbi:uncharacterized protein FFM5_15309 [Fusarium fujikuroi]|nr:uncharacterized protein FFM5_15309 [Fusarium fujikuroi]